MIGTTSGRCPGRDSLGTPWRGRVFARRLTSRSSRVRRALLNTLVSLMLLAARSTGSCTRPNGALTAQNIPWSFFCLHVANSVRSLCFVCSDVTRAINCGALAPDVLLVESIFAREVESLYSRGPLEPA